MQTIIFIILLQFSKIYQIFLLRKVKRSAIINFKHGINELPHSLINDVRLTILGN